MGSPSLKVRLKALISQGFHLTARVLRFASCFTATFVRPRPSADMPRQVARAVPAKPVWMSVWFFIAHTTLLPESDKCK
jgi:hypothetical protein